MDDFDNTDTWHWMVDREQWGDGWTDEEFEALIEAAQEYLDGKLPVIFVEEISDREIAGLYYELPGGNLQITGCSITAPQDVEDMTSEAWQNAIEVVSAKN